MTPAAATRLITVTIPGPAGPLEGLLRERDAATHEIAAVVCHPHPSFGGTLHNKVVHRVATVLYERGAAVLRFNFRGVGKSAGAYDQGEGELEDARAALAFLRARHPNARPWLAGFSFGSWIAARLAGAAPGIERLILVAPPVGTSSFEAMHSSPVPKLVIQGTADTTCRPGLLREEYPRWAEPKVLEWVEGATHFFDRQLGALAEALTRGLDVLQSPGIAS